MTNNKTQVLDWLNLIISDTENFQHPFYSEGEMRTLAEDALELLKEQDSRINDMGLIIEEYKTGPKNIVWWPVGAHKTNCRIGAALNQEIDF